MMVVLLWVVMVVVFCSIIELFYQVLGAIMMTKYTKYESGLWRTGVMSLISVVQNGIRSLSDATVLRNDTDRVILIWNCLIETVENFLFFDHSGLPALLPEQVRRGRGERSLYFFFFFFFFFECND